MPYAPRTARKSSRKKGGRNHHPRTCRILRGYDSDWYKKGGVRDQAIQRGLGLCTMCYTLWLQDPESHVIEPFTVVDHIIPIRVDPSRRLHLDNVWLLCAKHDAAKRKIEEGVYPLTQYPPINRLPGR